jgi:D-galactarolactone cycloisomerase
MINSLPSVPDRLSLSFLVRVETDTGIVGWGEAYAWGQQARVRDLVNTTFAPALIGQEVIDPRDLWNQLIGQRYPTPIYSTDGSVISKYLPINPFIDPYFTGAIIGGIDIALWDIIAKGKGQPICNLLGGALRSRIKVCLDIRLPPVFTRQFSDLANQSHSTLGFESVAALEERDYPGLGFDTFFIGPVSYTELAQQRIRATRAIFGRDATIIAEINTFDLRNADLFTTMSMEDLSLVSISSLSGIGGEILSDFNPVGSLPVAKGQDDWDVKMLCEAMARGHMDIIQPSLMRCGGFSGFLQLVHVAQKNGVRVMPFCSSSCGSAVALAATLQAAAVVPWPRRQGDKIEQTIKEPVINLSPEVYDVRNQLLVEGFMGSAGYLDVPQGPGLGVIVDEQVLCGTRS